MKSETPGFSLIELLVVLAIVVIVFSFAVPSFSHIFKSSTSRSFTSELVAFFNHARNTAVSEQDIITICPIGPTNQCYDDWTQSITAFRDSNRSKTVSDQSQIIRHLKVPPQGTLSVASANRNYFRFRGTGLAREAIGNIVWCPDSQNPGLATQVRINMGGRLYQSEDSNNDGVVEGTNGQPVTCP